MSWDRYLSDVLGVRQVVWPETPFVAPTEEEKSVDPDLRAQVRILFLAEPLGTPLLEREIFQRMLAAMKIETNEYLVWELSTVDLATREGEIDNEWVVVDFSPKLADYLTLQRPRLRQVATPHPAECEVNPKLKRQVWEGLKLALEKAGLSARLPS